MAKPWENYQQETQAAPWERYQSVEQTAAPDGFLSRMGEDLSKRGKRTGEILGAQGFSLLGEEQTLPETALQLAGEGADVFGDVLGNLAISGYENLVPEALKPSELTKEGFGTIGRGIYNIPTGYGALGDVVSGAYTSPEESTRTSRNIEALGSIGSMLIPIPAAKLPAKLIQAGSKFKGKVNKLIPDVKKFSADDLGKMSNVFYKQADDLGGVVKPNVVDDFLDNVSKKVLPQTPEGRIVSGGDDIITQTLGRMEGLRGKPVSLQGYQEIDEMLGDAIDSTIGLNGKVNKSGKKLLDIQRTFRNSIDNASVDDVVGGKEGFEALAEGRKLWQRQAKLRDIEKILVRAELSQQPATAVKSGLRTILSNPKKLRGYSPAEIAAMKDAANTGIGTELLNMVGSRLPSIVATGSGSPLVGGALRLGAIPARGVATSAQLGKLDDLSQLIARGAPARKLPSYLAAPKAIGEGAGASLEQLGGALGFLDKMRARQGLVLGLTNEIKGE